MRDYQLYLKDILAAIESIETFVEGMDRETFQADDKTASAVMRKFEIIGEAVSLPPAERLTRSTLTRKVCIRETRRFEEE